MKKIALIYPTQILPNSFYNFILPPLGLERIAAHVEDIANVKVFDLRFETNIISALKKLSPDIIGINVKTTMHALSNYDVADTLRQNFPTTKIIMGGLHATHCYEEALDHCDYVIRGDGELSFREYVLGKNLEDISGLCYRIDGKTYCSPLKNPNKNLDVILPPARHLRNKNYYYGIKPLFKIDLLETSRGCTHICTFCSPASTYPSCYRLHSPEYVLRELRTIATREVKFCWLTDDHLGGDLDRLEKICDLIINEQFQIIFFAFIRPFLGRIELKQKMAKAGFLAISYGAESPDQAQLIRYKKGHPSDSCFIKNVNKEFRDAGIIHIGNSFVFGDPFDSLETISKIGEHARFLGASYIEPLYAQPYPGTSYREEMKEKNMLLDRPWSDFTEARLLVKHPDATEEDLRVLRIKIWLDFLSPKKFFMQLGIPLALYKRTSISRIKIILFLKRVEKVIFGCLLEDKIYQNCYEKMVNDYFKLYINKFEKEEMEFKEQLIEILNFLGLNFIKKIFKSKSLEIRINDKETSLATFIVIFNKHELTDAYAATGNRIEQKNSIVFIVPLKLLAKRLASESYLNQTLIEALIVAINLFSLSSFKNLKTIFSKPNLQAPKTDPS